MEYYISHKAKIMKIYRFEDLGIWKDKRTLCNFIFEITKEEPFNKDYRFRDQIRAASGSIMDNIHPVK